MREYSLEQVAVLLSINTATLYRWLKRANITPRQDEHDKRRRFLSDEQVKVLRRLHQHAPIVVQKDSTTLATTLQMIQQQLDAMQDEIHALERRLDALQTQGNINVPLPPLTRPTHATAPPTTPPADIPSDAIPLYRLADEMGVKRRTLRDNVIAHGLPCIEGQSNRPGETPRFVTPEQVAYIRQWWHENK